MNHRELFLIGEVARLFHLSTGTLRHYEQLGVLMPEVVDEETGYRYYSTRQFESLNTIRYLRMMGIPLKEIARFLQNRDVGQMRNMLVHQKEEIIEKERQLKRVERKISNRLAQLEDALSDRFNEIRIVEKPSMRIAWIRNQIVSKSYLDLEKPIRELDANQTEPIVFLGKVGLGITKENLIQKRVNHYDMVYIILDEEDEYQGEAERLPACNCVTLKFQGGHPQAPGHYLDMLEYIEEHKLEIDGFAREVTMIDNGFTSDTSQFVTEIQIPVKKRENSK